MDEYANAAKRHLSDAELLFAQLPQRLGNASHLFGISAECSLKGMAKAVEPNVSFSGAKGHIPKLFIELINVAPAIGSNPDLVAKISAIAPLFASWEINQRYADESSFTGATAVLEKTGANQAYLLMSNYLQGLV